MEKIYTNIYKVSVYILVLSGVVALFAFGKIPFGFLASWSEQGFGTTIVFSHPEVFVEVGDSVVGYGEEGGEVDVYTVREILRREGMVYYRVSEQGNLEELSIIAARDLSRKVVVTVPFLGFLVSVLLNKIGILLFCVLPLCMVLIDKAVKVTSKLVMFTQLVQHSLKSNRTMRQVTQMCNSDDCGIDTNCTYIHKNRDGNNFSHITILKPYTLHHL